MSSAQHLREFISQRLTAAAEEIFTEFEKIIVQYEEEIDRQRRLLEITWKPQISFHRVDLPQHYLCQEQLNLQKDSSLDQQEPEPLQIKEEQVEVCTSQETENFTVGRPQQEPEPTSEQLLRQNSQWSRGQEGSGHESPGNAELRGKKTHHRDDGDGSSTSGSGRNTVKDFSQQYVCEEQEEFLSDQRFFHHQSNSSLEQEEPEPPQFKEELEEPESPQFKEELEEQEEEWLVLKEEADIVLVTPIYEESDHSEQELSSDQLLSQNSSAAQSQDLGKNWHEESESTQTATLQPNKRHERTDGISGSPFNAGDTGDRTAECEVCGRAFRSYSELRAHYRLHTELPQHIVREMLFTDQHLYNQENNSSLDEEEIYTKSPTLENPCNTDAGTSSVKYLEGCGKPFKKNFKIQEHYIIDTDEKLHSCEICQKDFRKRKHLLVHMRIHTGEKPYSCDICAKSFSQNGHLTVHMRTHTGEKPYLCKTCGKRFSDSSILKNHMLIHTGEKPFSCKICEKTFRYSSSLTVHMKIHTGEKPYLCKICGKSYRHNSTLIAHMRNHSGDKSYSCKTCSKGFTQSSALMRHESIHTSEKPYSCQTCGKCFRNSNYLSIHTRIHTGEKSYSCKLCGKSFSRSPNLLRHTRTHIGEKL